MNSALGYGHPGYALSLAEFGKPVELPRSGGWILERRVPASPYSDAIGLYPLFFCREWSQLEADLRDLEGRLVAVSAVPDPFGEHDPELLRECFGDLMVPYKEHFVTDMHRPLAESVSRHHRKCARKALEVIHGEVLDDPPAFLDEWIELHRNLVARHDVKGMRAFSRAAFAAQLRLPGMVVVLAKAGETTVGAQLWFQHGDVAYGHVLAFNQLGYEVGAAYGLYWLALEHFAGKVRWCCIGGVSGTDAGQPGGLAQFKRGWATSTRTAYLCGRILDRPKYQELVRLNGSDPAGFFPAYRSSIA